MAELFRRGESVKQQQPPEDLLLDDGSGGGGHDRHYSFEQTLLGFYRRNSEPSRFDEGENDENESKKTKAAKNDQFFHSKSEKRVGEKSEEKEPSPQQNQLESVLVTATEDPSVQSYTGNNKAVRKRSFFVSPVVSSSGENNKKTVKREAEDEAEEVESPRKNVRFVSMDNTAFASSANGRGMWTTEESEEDGGEHQRGSTMRSKVRGLGFSLLARLRQWALACKNSFSWKAIRLVLIDWLFLAILGIGMALLSMFMDNVIERMQTFQVYLMEKSGQTGYVVLDHLCTYLSWLFYTQALVICSAIFVHYVAPQAIGSGIPEMKTVLRGVVLKDYLSGRTLLSKIVGLTLSLGSGVPIGKMGPFVHLAANAANLLSRVAARFEGAYGNECRRTEMLAAACATGVACTFSAPVGGVLLSIELTTMYFSVHNYWRGFFAAACGATVFRLLRVVYFKQEITLVAFYQTRIPENAFVPRELPFFALIGLLCGFFGAAFIQFYKRLVMFLRTSPLAKRVFQRNWITYPAVISFIVATVTYPRGYGRFLSGHYKFTRTVLDFFSNCTWSMPPLGSADSPHGCPPELISQWTNHEGYGPYNVFLVLSLFILTFVVLAALSTTMPIPCGMFMPLFVIGAAFGRLCGEIVASIYPNGIPNDANVEQPIFPGIYAVVGAASLTGAITHSVSVAMICCEITGQLIYLIPLMIAVIIANAVCTYLQPSIYDVIIGIKNLPYLPDIPPSNAYVHLATAEDIMVSDVHYICRFTSFAQIKELLLRMPKLRSFPVVDDASSMMLVGSISKRTLIDLLDRQIGDAARRTEAAQRIRLAIETIDRHFREAQAEMLSARLTATGTPSEPQSAVESAVESGRSSLASSSSSTSSSSQKQKHSSSTSSPPPPPHQQPSPIGSTTQQKRAPKTETVEEPLRKISEPIKEITSEPQYATLGGVDRKELLQKQLQQSPLAGRLDRRAGLGGITGSDQRLTTAATSTPSTPGTSGRGSRFIVRKTPIAEEDLPWPLFVKRRIVPPIRLPSRQKFSIITTGGSSGGSPSAAQTPTPGAAPASFIHRRNAFARASVLVPDKIESTPSDDSESEGSNGSNETLKNNENIHSSTDDGSEHHQHQKEHQKHSASEKHHRKQSHHHHHPHHPGQKDKEEEEEKGERKQSPQFDNHYGTISRNIHEYVQFAKKHLQKMQQKRQKESGAKPEYDLFDEERRKWESQRLAESVELDDRLIDPAPFQLVPRTSVYKVHSVFSLLDLNRAYVTDRGRLVGIVALRDLRMAIQNSANFSAVHESASVKRDHRSVSMGTVATLLSNAATEGDKKAEEQEEDEEAVGREDFEAPPSRKESGLSGVSSNKKLSAASGPTGNWALSPDADSSSRTFFFVEPTPGVEDGEGRKRPTTLALEPLTSGIMVSAEDNNQLQGILLEDTNDVGKETMVAKGDGDAQTCVSFSPEILFPASPIRAHHYHSPLCEEMLAESGEVDRRRILQQHQQQHQSFDGRGEPIAALASPTQERVFVVNEMASFTETTPTAPEPKSATTTQNQQQQQQMRRRRLLSAHSLDVASFATSYRERRRASLAPPVWLHEQQQPRLPELPPTSEALTPLGFQPEVARAVLYLRRKSLALEGMEAAAISSFYAASSSSSSLSDDQGQQNKEGPRSPRYPQPCSSPASNIAENP